MSQRVSTESCGFTAHGVRRARPPLGDAVPTLYAQNEDAFACFPDEGLHMVIDGMGGADCGDVAAALAIEAIHEGLRAGRAEGRRGGELLASSIEHANLRILGEATRDRRRCGMGATIAALLVDDGSAHVAHVGDARVYRLRTDNLTLVTRPYSFIHGPPLLYEDLMAEALAEIERESRGRALGVMAGVTIEIESGPAVEGDLFLLCSDGLYGALATDEIASLLAANAPRSLESAAHALVGEAMERWGSESDDTTVALVRIAAA